MADLQAGKELAQRIETDVDADDGGRRAGRDIHPQRGGHPRLAVGEEDVHIGPVDAIALQRRLVPGTAARIVGVRRIFLDANGPALGIAADPGDATAARGVLDRLGVDGAGCLASQHQEVAVLIAEADDRELRNVSQHFRRKPFRQRPVRLVESAVR